MVFEIIGEGERGYVIYPAINGDLNFVSKIMLEDNIKDEIIRVGLLPDNPGYKKPTDLSIYPIGELEVGILEELYVFDEEDRSKFYYNIPYIKGCTLENFDYSTNDYQACVKLINAFGELKRNLKQLHDDGFYHGSIFACNLIFDGEKIYMIDFGMCGIIGETDWKNVDNADLNNLYEIYLDQCKENYEEFNTRDFLKIESSNFLNVDDVHQDDNPRTVRSRNMYEIERCRKMIAETISEINKIEKNLFGKEIVYNEIDHSMAEIDNEDSGDLPKDNYNNKTELEKIEDLVMYPTNNARKMMSDATEFIIDKYGGKVVYGDSDTIMIGLNMDDIKSGKINVDEIFSQTAKGFKIQPEISKKDYFVGTMKNYTGSDRLERLEPIRRNGIAAATGCGVCDKCKLYNSYGYDRFGVKYFTSLYCGGRPDSNRLHEVVADDNERKSWRYHS